LIIFFKNKKSPAIAGLSKNIVESGLHKF